MAKSNEVLDAITAALDPRPVEDPALRTKLEKLRTVAGSLSRGIYDVVPEGVERDRALLLVREALMWSVAGCEVHQPESDPRVRPARVSEEMAQAMRDGKMPPLSR